MSTSGVKVSDDVMKRFDNMKMKKKDRFMLSVIDGDFVVHQSTTPKTDNQEADFNNFMTALSNDHCCFAILDLTCDSPSAHAGAGTGKGKEVLFNVAWCPDTCALREKMIYAATRLEVNEKIKDGVRCIQANDHGDLEYNELLKLGKSGK